MNGYQIPLSYNAIDHEGLFRVLDKYKDKNHQTIIRDFEEQVKSLSGAQHVVALNSGTAALHLALKVLGVGKSDKVLVSSFTYVASVSPILYCGASPVFIDSEEITYNMDPDLLEMALKDLSSKGSSPKAIIVVHAYGMPAQMDKILTIAKKWGVPVIEDAAEAFGATINEQWAGSMAELGIYSFNNNKSITTFGGGILLTNNEEQASMARKLSTHAREEKSYYDHNELGYNYAISPLNAAYGQWACREGQVELNERQNTFSAYKEALSQKLIFQTELEGVKSSRWLTIVRLDNEQVEKGLLKQLTDNQQFEIRNVWNPMHVQPLFIEEKAYLNGVSDSLFKSALCLPSGQIPDMEFRRLVLWLQSML